MQTLQLQVSLMRQFWRVEAAFAEPFAIHHDLYAPFTLMCGNAQKSGVVGFSRLAHVLKIAKPRNLAQVGKRVVLLVSVFVVNVMRRILTNHVKPCKPMGESFFVVDGDSPVAGNGWTASAFANKIRSACVLYPNKPACAGVVFENGSEMVSGNHEFQFTIGMTK